MVLSFYSSRWQHGRPEEKHGIHMAKNTGNKKAPARGAFLWSRA